MDINRNQWFLAGLLALLLGLQFRMIDSVVLTPEFTKFLAEQTGHPVAAASETMQTIVGTTPRIPPKTIRPPESVGWALLSVGAVFILHSLSLRRPE
ncbi:MAG: hypothetical protein ACYTG0_45675 [Planctomycetota bacterium]|jgi:hypothetical protein